MKYKLSSVPSIFFVLLTCIYCCLFPSYILIILVVIHAYAKTGGVGAAKKAQELLISMHMMYRKGNHLARPDTITVSYPSNIYVLFKSLPSPHFF